MARIERRLRVRLQNTSRSSGGAPVGVAFMARASKQGLSAAATAGRNASKKPARALARCGEGSAASAGRGRGEPLLSVGVVLEHLVEQQGEEARRAGPGEGPVAPSDVHVAPVAGEH